MRTLNDSWVNNDNKFFLASFNPLVVLLIEKQWAHATAAYQCQAHNGTDNINNNCMKMYEKLFNLCLFYFAHSACHDFWAKASIHWNVNVQSRIKNSQQLKEWKWWWWWQRERENEKMGNTNRPGWLLLFQHKRQHVIRFHWPTLYTIENGFSRWIFSIRSFHYENNSFSCSFFCSFSNNWQHAIDDDSNRKFNFCFNATFRISQRRHIDHSNACLVMIARAYFSNRHKLSFWMLVRYSRIELIPHMEHLNWVCWRVKWASNRPDIKNICKLQAINYQHRQQQHHNWWTTTFCFCLLDHQPHNKNHERTL